MTSETPARPDVPSTPRHTCLIYDDPAEGAAAVLPFLLAGLSRSERCIYVAYDSGVEAVAAALAAEGLDVEAARQDGSLLLWTRDEWRQPSPIDREQKLALLREVLSAASADGRARVRFAIEMTWTLGPDLEPGEVEAWEALLDGFLLAEAPQSSMVCMYNRRRLPPDTTISGLRTHAFAHRPAGDLPNPFYAAPQLTQALEGQEASSAEKLDWMLSRLGWVEAVEAERRERQSSEEALLAAEETRERAEREARKLAQLSALTGLISAELDVERAVQGVTDAATGAVGAQFGAFFYNVEDERGESYTLYTISGARREDFEGFPLPRNTDLFGPTFRGEGVVRLDDVQADPRYGKNPPHHGMPKGHLPVRSYLAVPVHDRRGDVLGGLFFGHADVGVFTAEDETLVEALAAHAAIAIDNARLYEAAQRAVTVRDRFLATAAHELRTPLTVLNGYAQLMARRLQGGTLNEEHLRNSVEQLVLHTGRMGKLVNDLLDASRIQRGRLDLQRSPVDLATLASTVLARFEDAPPRTPAHRLVLEASEPVVGEWDAGRLDQVLTNLIHNALTYSPDGGEVRVSVEANRAEASLRVRDEGVGIPAHEREQLFEPFHRGQAHAHGVAGSGLGLYISAEIVHQHGGRIAVTTEPGQGSTFEVVLPLSDGEPKRSRRGRAR